MGPDWRCVLANDLDAKKCETYRDNWGDQSLYCCDVRDLDARLLNQPMDLYWASSPCQDFSLAGRGLGLSGKQSGAFSAWIKLISNAVASGYAPRIVAFENVTGLVSRAKGRDFSHVLEEFIKLGYSVGAHIIDARSFLPQSRPRVFVIAVRNDFHVPQTLVRQVDMYSEQPLLQKYVANAPAIVKQNWVSWFLPEITKRSCDISQIIDSRSPHKWLSPENTKSLLSIMSPANLKKVTDASLSGKRRYLTLYKRGRPLQDGVIRQRAEVRNDGIAGCLRTPGGGSSRQTLLEITGDKIKARLLSPRETARLMGLSDAYKLPEKPNDAYRLTGDGVAVPVVRYLRQNIFEPLAMAEELHDAA